MLRNANGYFPVTPPGEHPLPVKGSPQPMETSVDNNNNNSSNNNKGLPAPLQQQHHYYNHSNSNNTDMTSKTSSLEAVVTVRSPPLIESNSSNSSTGTCIDRNTNNPYLNNNNHFQYGNDHGTKDHTMDKTSSNNSSSSQGKDNWLSAEIGVRTGSGSSSRESPMEGVQRHGSSSSLVESTVVAMAVARGTPPPMMEINRGSPFDHPSVIMRGTTPIDVRSPFEEIQQQQQQQQQEQPPKQVSPFEQLQQLHLEQLKQLELQQLRQQEQIQRQQQQQQPTTAQQGAPRVPPVEEQNHNHALVNNTNLEINIAHNIPAHNNNNNNNNNKSSQFEQGRGSPVQVKSDNNNSNLARASPFENNQHHHQGQQPRESPVTEIHHGSPFDNTKVSPFEIARGSPFEAPRGPFFEPVVRGSPGGENIPLNNFQHLQQQQQQIHQQQQQQQQQHQPHNRNINRGGVAVEVKRQSPSNAQPMALFQQQPQVHVVAQSAQQPQPQPQPPVQQQQQQQIQQLQHPVPIPQVQQQQQHGFLQHRPTQLQVMVQRVQPGHAQGVSPNLDRTSPLLHPQQQRPQIIIAPVAAGVVQGFQTIERHVDQSLENETEATLNERYKADLMLMCHERGLPAEGKKEALIQALLDWQQAKPVPGPSTPKLCSVEPAMAVKKAPINTLHLNSLLLDENFQGEIAYEQLTVGRKLGSGGFKDCYAGTYKGEAVAIGELRVQNFTEMDITEMKHEINVLKQLRHENIIEFIGVCTNIKHLCIVTELCENGDLYDFMRKTKKPSFGQLIMYMHDIALACSYLHTRRPSIIHRDMKSMNVLISSDDRAKINDFGLARIRPQAKASLHTQCGTPNWQAPEFWTPNPSYTEKVDVYACGLIYWEILSWAELGYPYHNLTEHQLYEAVRDKEERPPLEKLRKYPQSLLSLIQEMWKKDPKKRPSMSHVVDRLAEYLE